MFSSIIPAIFRPVSVMCGLTSPPDCRSSNKGVNKDQTTAIPENKPVSRCISQASTHDSTDDSSSSSRRDSADEDEVCARMAQLGKAARKAGRHVLRGNKLVLS
jgi:hypothetical protein